jgi:hypothetical protein
MPSMFLEADTISSAYREADSSSAYATHLYSDIHFKQSKKLADNQFSHASSSEAKADCIYAASTFANLVYREGHLVNMRIFRGATDLKPTAYIGFEPGAYRKNEPWKDL